MTKTEIEFYIDGKCVGSSFLTVEGRKFDTQAAEDEFYAVLRKNENNIVEAAEEAEREHILNNLTKEQENKLQELHLNFHPMLLDDEMSDHYDDWVSNLTLDEVKEYLK